MAIVLPKSIFYHIPKTGGTWVSYVLRHSVDMKGLTYRRPKRDYSFDVDDETYWRRFIAKLLVMYRAHETPCSTSEEDKRGRYSFAFVRRPETWLQSFWIDRKHLWETNKKSLLPSKKVFLLDSAWDEDFDTFVENALKMFPLGPVSTIFQAFLGRDGDDLDFVGRQENLRADLIDALEYAGETFDSVPIKKEAKINTSKRRKRISKPELSTKVRNKLLKQDAWVLETFYK